jgi:hypothetical protein
MRTSEWGAALTVPVMQGPDHIQGPADAPVTLLEYGDYSNGARHDGSYDLDTLLGPLT